MSKFNEPPNSFEESSTKRKSSQCYAKKVAPDGGWGWMIVLGSFIGMILGTFPVFSFSILFSPILMSHSVSSTKTAWIYNVHSLVWSLITLFIGPLCDEFGWRKVAMFGGITNSISVILSAFAPNPEYLFFSFSLLGGVGGSTALSLSFFVVSRYFDKHRGFALGITTLGGCTSSFLAPIVANYLLEHFGYTGASLIFGAIVLNQCVGGSLYQPVEWHLKSEEAKTITEEDVNEELLRSSKITSNSNDIQKKTIQGARRISAISELSTDSLCHSLINITNMPTLLEAENNNNEEDIPKNVNSVDKFLNVLKSTYNNLKSLKYMRVNLIAWGYCGLVLGYINFQMWIPFVITNAGHSLEMAAWCSSFASIGNVIGRLVMSLLSDRKFFNVRYGYMFGLFLIGSSIIERTERKEG
ncbi:Monocarboxylate transporter 12-B [Armadillidium nasatum]|uniref:Monocarboxylate transporter 12-B n=1 Tax=Armadillidium nasatum TaxID=96803 RepID=A0A5N5TE84_9CRUS|nr:Monocarboxylate transporter 12-B [Armadillidium nasatum]